MISHPARQAEEADVNGLAQMDTAPVTEENRARRNAESLAALTARMRFSNQPEAKIANRRVCKIRLNFAQRSPHHVHSVMQSVTRRMCL